MNLNYLYIGLLRWGELGLVEVSQEETNYRRIEMGPGDWYFQDDALINADTIKFNIATKRWGLATHFGVFDSLNEGKLLVVGTLDLESVIYIEKYIQLQFEAGKLTIKAEALGLEIENG